MGQGRVGVGGVSAIRKWGRFTEGGEGKLMSVSKALH